MTDLPLSPEQLLTPEECALVDATLLPYRDRFAARLAVYSLRTLKAIAEPLGVTVLELQPEQIGDWVKEKQDIQQEADQVSGFADWYVNILISAMKPLQTIAQANGVAIEDLEVSQVVNWFEEQFKLQNAIQNK